MRNLTFIFIVATLAFNACTAKQNTNIERSPQQKNIQQTESIEHITNNNANINEVIKTASAECWEWNEWVNDGTDGYETPLPDKVCNCYVALFPKHLSKQDKDDLLMWDLYWNKTGNFERWNRSPAKKRVAQYQLQILEECKK
jgi:hypothetical protein